MTTDELTTIRKRWQQTTGGEWEAVMWMGDKGGAVWGEHFPVMRADWYKTTADRTLEQTKNDLEFAAHAHQDVPTLLDEVERLQAEIARLTAGKDGES
jgi:hypothetical protein